MAGSGQPLDKAEELANLDLRLTTIFCTYAEVMRDTRLCLHGSNRILLRALFSPACAL